MSGAPVLDFSAGLVIGMLRTSRDTSSDLGAWVVPAELIRRLWPERVRAAHERFHRGDDRWRLATQAAATTSTAANAAPPHGNIRTGDIAGEIITIVNGGNFRDLNIGRPQQRGPRHPGERSGRS